METEVEICERIQDRVEVGGDGHAEHLEIVTDVPDDGHVRRVGYLDDALHEARAADPAREHDDLHRSASAGRFARQVCDRGPSRRWRRRRSSIVSTSSIKFGRAAETASSPSVSALARKRAALSGP